MEDKISTSSRVCKEGNAGKQGGAGATDTQQESEGTGSRTGDGQDGPTVTELPDAGPQHLLLFPPVASR